MWFGTFRCLGALDPVMWFAPWQQLQDDYGATHNSAGYCNTFGVLCLPPGVSYCVKVSSGVRPAASTASPSAAGTGSGPNSTTRTASAALEVLTAAANLSDAASGEPAATCSCSWCGVSHMACCLGCTCQRYKAGIVCNAPQGHSVLQLGVCGAGENCHRAAGCWCRLHNRRLGLKPQCHHHEHGRHARSLLSPSPSPPPPLLPAPQL